MSKRITAALLALCFPFFGAQRFYLGQVASGVALLLTPIGVLLIVLLAAPLPRELLAAAAVIAAGPTLWSVVSGLRLLSLSDAAFEQEQEQAGSGYANE